MDRRLRGLPAAVPSITPFPTQTAVPKEPFPLPYKERSRSLAQEAPRVPLLLGGPKPVPLDAAEVPATPPQAPETMVRQNQGNQIFNKWKNQCQPGQGSPDQVEGQPVDDEGLEGRSPQSQVELEPLPGGRGPHAVGAQGCCSQRARLGGRPRLSWAGRAHPQLQPREDGRGSPAPAWGRGRGRAARLTMKYMRADEVQASAT